MVPAKKGPAHVGSDLSPPPKTWLNRRRRELDVNQYELAGHARISERTLSRLENGETINPPLLYLVNCAYALGIEDWTDIAEDAWLVPGKTAPGGLRPARIGEQAPFDLAKYRD